MRRHRHMQQKYFIRQLTQHLFIITLPILLLGCLLTGYSQNKLQQELAVYAERSKTYVLYNVTDLFDTFSEETALFSSSPTIALSISKLLNQKSLDYRDSVYKSLIPLIISTTTDISSYVDSVYIYYDNPYGNYFSSSKQYTSIGAPNSTDTEWLSVYKETPADIKQWIALRQVRHYAFENTKETLSLFRRFDYLEGVMVLNLDAAKVSAMLDANQIYPGACTFITDAKGNILLGSAGYEALTGDSSNTAAGLLSPKDNPYDTAVLQHTRYIYYTSAIPGYNLEMISLLPSSEVFRPVHTLVIAFALLTLFSIFLSFSLSWSVTSSNFRQLHNLLELFHQAEHQELPAETFRPDAQNEYDIIFNNIVQSFISTNLLKLNLTQAKVQQKDAQLAALQLQLNPHFIFNTLQTIDLEILKFQSSDNHTSLLIHNLSDILKYSLENTSKTVHIRDEIRICKAYAEIQKLRYRNPFILYWDYDERLLERPIIHLILQPLLENSLQHGIKEIPQKGLVKIKIQERGGRIHIYIIDNGIGISKDRLDELRRLLQAQEQVRTSHIGIFNTNLRLVLTYGADAGIDIKSREGRGTIVHFSLPLC